MSVCGADLVMQGDDGGEIDAALSCLADVPQIAALFSVMTQATRRVSRISEQAGAQVIERAWV